MTVERNKWKRLFVSFLIMSLGCGGQYLMSVALVPMQTEFGATRSLVSFGYTLHMVFFGLGGVVMGRLFDRFGTMVPTILGAILIGIGFIATGLATDIRLVWLFYGLFAGFGGAATFAPLIADTALSFDKNRGLAVAICACGNYFAGMLWPPAMQHFFESYGWRPAFIGAGIICLVTIAPLAVMLRSRPVASLGAGAARGSAPGRPFGLAPGAAMILLCIAGVGCCVAMAMPQVHLVAYCGQLGYSAQQGAQMIALLFAGGIVSRVASGAISDRIGGIRTLVLGASLQALALLLFLTSSDLQMLYFFAVFFGLVQGGVVPAYAVIVREHFESSRAGQTTATILMATLGGMALGGFLPGLIFDYTGSYQAAFLNAIAWNVLNVVIVLFLWRRFRNNLGLSATA